MPVSARTKQWVYFHGEVVIYIYIYMYFQAPLQQLVGGTDHSMKWALHILTLKWARKQTVKIQIRQTKMQYGGNP